MYIFRGRSADEVWRQAHQAISERLKFQPPQPSRGGDTIELLHAAIEVEDPTQRWITSRSPGLNPALGIAEAICVLAGSDDSAVLNYWFPGLATFQGGGSRYAGAYGSRLRTRFGIDQIARACDVLSADPSSRQVVLQLWDTRSDLPNEDGSSRSQDIPCNVLSLLKVRGGRLEWTQVMRSNDLYRGLPYNFLQFTILQEVIAGWLGIELGTYHHWSDSLHVYVSALGSFSCKIANEPVANSDTLATDVNSGQALISELYSRMRELTMPNLSESSLSEVVTFRAAPEGYQNLLRVLGAESARRHRRSDQADALMQACTNAQLVGIWGEWLGRVRPPSGLLPPGERARRHAPANAFSTGKPKAWP